MSVNLIARKQLTEAINKFINDEINSYEFDDLIKDIRTHDKTIKDCVSALWYFYDDLKKHKAVLSKHEWDMLQRILLLLDGRGEIEASTELVYLRENVILLIILGAMASMPLVVSWIQSGTVSLSLWVILSVSTVVVHVLKKRQLAKLDPFGSYLVPFGSMREIATARRRSMSFKKQKYRNEIKRRTIRHRILESDVTTIGYMLLVLIAPLVALFGVLPARIYNSKVVTSSP